MRIAVFATSPKDVFSGGRYHALMIAQVLARRGHESYFVTNNHPIFVDDVAPISEDNPVNIVVTSRFDIGADNRFDAVFIAPQMAPFPGFYKNAVRFARESDAGLILINYETPNWFNAYSPVKRPKEKWIEWEYVAREGALILCSAGESLKFAKQYYIDLPPETDFDVWQPAINSLACAAVPPQKREKLIVLFSRPSDKHKGGADIVDLIGPELSGYTIGVIIGNPQKSEQFLDMLRQRGNQHNVHIEPYFALSDHQKFVLLKRASCLVFPSYFEGYGYPPMEALAADTPCIAYDLPVVRENCGDLIRYAPVGDVDALRNELLKALQSGVTKTSSDQHVIHLTDVDERGKALEKTIKNYLEKRTKTLSSASDISIADWGLSPASIIHVNHRPHVLFALTGRVMIKDVSSKSKVIRSAQILQGPSNKGIKRYTIVLNLNEKIDLKKLRKEILKLHLVSGLVQLSLANLKISTRNVPWISEKFCGLNEVLQNGNKVMIIGWAYPAKPYDTLYLMDKSDRIIQLETAIKNLHYQKQCRDDIDVFCGFMSGVINLAEFNIDTLRLIFINEGVIVGKTKISATGVLKSSQDLLLIGHSEKDDEAVVEEDAGSNSRSIITTVEPKPIVIGPSVLSAPLISRRSFFENVIKKGHRKLILIYTGIRNATLRKQNLADIPIKWALNECSYKEDAGDIVVRGWSNQPDQIRVEIWDNDLRLVGVAENGQSRPDIASELGILGRDDFGFLYQGPYRGELDKGMIIRLLLGPKLITQKIVKSLTIKDRERFKVEDYLFEQRWNLLWMRGSYENDDVRLNKRLDKLEILKNEQVIAVAAIDEKLRPNGKAFLKWRVESVVEDIVEPGECLTVRITSRDGAERFGLYNVPIADKLMKNTSVHGGQLRHAGNGEHIFHRLNFLGESPDNKADHTILLIAHNLNAVERVEKRTALECVRRELNAKGVELICLHHSMQPAGCAIPEVNFFSAELKKLNDDLLIERKKKREPLIEKRNWQGYPQRKIFKVLSEQHSGPEHVDVAALNYAQRMLFGFLSALNRRPKPWSDVEKQTIDEVAKIETVIKAVKPSLVLLWHQWNSLAVLGRAVADRHGIPSAIIHEGMIPGTMTIDVQGMMAESDSTGVRLNARGRDVKPYFDQARHLIAEIKTKGLDRKPSAGTSAASQIIQAQRKRGIKTVFYAGVNDWQSGNLPADHPRAKVHSPYFMDTIDGLKALLGVAERMEFMVLFKPHPNLFPHSLEIEHDRLIYVREANATDCIRETDITLTLLSSLAYISLAHGKPTVLMGRNTLSGVQAAYELEDYNDLDACISDALLAKQHDQRLLKYESHIAALLKDHLYPYGEVTNFSMLTYRDTVQKLLEIMSDKKSDHVFEE